MSQTIEIPRERWGDYLSALANRMKDRPTQLELEEKDGHRRALSEKMPLVGISWDPKGSGHCELEVTVEGADPGKGMSFEHCFHEPKRVLAETGDDGKVQCLDIEDADGRTHVIF